jgi:hypothetical protein
MLERISYGATNWIALGGSESKPRDLGSDRGYRVADFQVTLQLKIKGNPAGASEPGDYRD